MLSLRCKIFYNLYIFAVSYNVVIKQEIFLNVNLSGPNMSGRNNSESCGVCKEARSPFVRRDFHCTLLSHLTQTALWKARAN